MIKPITSTMKLQRFYVLVLMLIFMLIFIRNIFLNGIKRIHRLLSETLVNIRGIFLTYNQALCQTYPVHLLSNLFHGIIKNKGCRRAQSYFSNLDVACS